MMSDYQKIALDKNMLGQEGKWEKREKDTAVCKELDQFVVNKVLPSLKNYTFLVKH